MVNKIHNKEQQRLLELLQANKISYDDYKLLLAALKPDASPLFNFYTFILNPFNKLSGMSAVYVGIVIIAILSYISVNINACFPGVMDYMILPPGKNIHLTFIKLLLQNIILCGTLSLTFLLAAIACRQKGLRISDFIGMVMVSRFPFLIFSIIINLYVYIIKPASTIPSNNIAPSFVPITLILFIIITWHMILYFNALKESSSLTGSKLWTSFLITFILSEGIAQFVITSFLMA